MRHRGYWLLIAGFFVCGFQLGFMANHLPAYLLDNAMTPTMGATALGMIGFFNIIGSYACGYLGGKYSKKYLLAGLYLGRAVVMLAFVWVPLSNVSILVFSGLMGLTWLATVPLTSGLVGQIFGVQYLSTLFGIVFFTHQVGGVLGVWLAGYLFDVTGSYEVMWYISMALGLAAALLHWPINEQQVERLRSVGGLGEAG
jgi:MFS family permease